MAKITKEMSYSVADDYLSQSTKLGNKATNTFIGPDLMWVDVWKEDKPDEGQVKGTFTLDVLKTNYLDDGDIEDYENADQADAIRALPVPLDCDRVEINCDENPHICAMFIGGKSVGDETGSYEMLPQVDFTLTGETKPFYSRVANDSTPPDHVYDKETSVFDVITGKWDLKLMQSHRSWDDLRRGRNLQLDATDVKEALPEGKGNKDLWMTYRQELRDLPSKFDGYEAFMVPNPDSPDDLVD